MSIKSVMPSNHLILRRPLILLPLIFLSFRVFSNESVLRIRWPRYCSFSLNINPSNEHPGLISFRMDWLDLLAVQGTLKSHLQHYSSKASILQHSTFFIVQLSHPYTLKQCYKMFIIAFSTYFNKMEIKSFCFLPQSIKPKTRHLEIIFKLLIAITHVLKYYASLSLVFLSKRIRVYSTAKGKQQKRVLIKYQLICFLCMSH